MPFAFNIPLSRPLSPSVRVSPSWLVSGNKNLTVLSSIPRGKNTWRIGTAAAIASFATALKHRCGLRRRRCRHRGVDIQRDGRRERLFPLSPLTAE